MQLFNQYSMQDQVEGPQVHVDSVRLMAEAASIAVPSPAALRLISEDVTLRLKQIIAKALKFMKHANRKELSCADINRSMRWSDCQPIFGFERDPHEKLQYSYSTEAQVFRYGDDTVDLSERYGQALVDFTDILTEEVRLEAMPELTIESLAINDQFEL